MLFNQNAIRPYIFGLPWLNETWPQLLRIPQRITKNLSRSIKQLATNLSGARIRFICDSSYIRFKAQIPHFRPMNNFSADGQFGCDLYVDGHYWQTMYQPGQINQIIRFKSIKSHIFEIYLPLYGPLSIQRIETEGPLQQAPPYRDPRPIIYYGSSITQGGCASRASMSYNALIERRLNLDFVNLGLSGNGTGDLIIAELIAEIEPLMVVFDWGANLIQEKLYTILTQRYEKFYRIIRNAHHNVPIILINLPFIREEFQSSSVHEYVETFRLHIESVFQNAKNSGDQALWRIPALTFIGPEDQHCTVDGTHPNDLGFCRYADGLCQFFEKEGILKYALDRKKSN
jgi:hypothetical protein